jgi:PadR family transcriptional regulator, regulatory protein PadR
MSRSPLSPALTHVLAAVAHGSSYGFDITEATGLPSGTVYPALSRLEEDGYLRSRWESPRIAQREKRPARRYYEMTATGERVLNDAIAIMKARERARRGQRRLLRPVRERA